MGKTRRLIALFLAMSSCYCISKPSNIVEANENTLDTYEYTLSNFNDEYGTNYQFASYDDMKSCGMSYEDALNFIYQMDQDEFNAYLYEIYSNSINHSANLDCQSVDNTKPSDSTMQSGTQKHYYSGSYSKYFYINATWSYGDGYYRYTNIQNAGSYSDGQSFPCWVCRDYSYSLTNSSRSVNVKYYCDKFIGPMLTDATSYTVTHTFNAGQGDTSGTIVI